MEKSTPAPKIKIKNYLLHIHFLPQILVKLKKKIKHKTCLLNQKMSNNICSKTNQT